MIRDGSPPQAEEDEDEEPFDSEALLKQMLKRKEELDYQLHLEKDRAQQRLELTRKEIHDLGNEKAKLTKDIKDEKKALTDMKYLGMSYDTENDNYKKLKEDDRKFLQLNIERLKLMETPVD